MVEITFLNNLLVRQVITNVYLPGEISTCPKQTGRVHFDVVSLEKVRDYYRIYIISYFYRIHNIVFIESSSCARVFNQSDVIDTFYSEMAIAFHAFIPKISYRSIQKINIHYCIRKLDKNIIGFLSLALLFLFCFVISHILGGSSKMF